MTTKAQRQLVIMCEDYLTQELDWAEKNGLLEKMHKHLFYLLMWGPVSRRELHQSRDLGDHGFVVYVDMPHSKRPYVIGMVYRADGRDWSMHS